MAAPRFVDQLNIQIGNEVAAHQQYVAIAVHFDALTMPRLASFFYRQALEERDHAMMMVQYLIDADERVTIPGIASPVTVFETLEEPIALALEQERRVAEQINELTGIARDARDFASDQFMQWFIKEQVEEVATMSDLLTVVRRSKDDIEDIELWVARETGGAEADPSAPAVAGAE
jgi:ferritin